MKLKPILATVLLLFTSQQALAANCYLLITESAGFKYNAVFEVSSTLLNNFVAKVLEVPRSGLGAKDCTYNLAILKDHGTLTLSINGPEISSIGESKDPGLLGVQKALLTAIFRSDEEVREELCEGYKNLIQDQCDSFSQNDNPLEGIWAANYDDENEATFMEIDQENDILICELKNLEVASLSEGKIVDDQFFWGKDKPIEISLEEDNLVLHYEEGDDPFQRVDELPEACLKKIEEEY